MSDPVETSQDVIEVLKEHDGDPTALVDHRQIRYLLAEWRFGDDYDAKIKYQKVDNEINWRSVNMSKSLFEEMIEGIYQDMQENEDEEDEAIDLADTTPEEFYSRFKWGDMPDRQIAYWCNQWTRENTDIIYSNKQVLVRKGDIWERDEKMVARILRALVGEHYGDNVKKEFLKGYISVDDAYRVERSKIGLSGPRCVVENGVLNLVKGEIERDVRRDDYAIIKFPVKWEGSDAPRERFENDFLRMSVASDDVQKLQEFAGYCLHTNEYPYKKALMMVGAGNNGKGVFEQILCGLLGPENTMHDDLKDLSNNQFGAQRLRYKAANINSDIDGNKIENFSIFKKLTGRDPVRVEQKYKEAFSIKNPAKLLFASNKIPKVKDATLAFYARWIFVHFPNKFTTVEGDGYLPADPYIQDDIIENELPGVLAWAVEGYQRLHEQQHFTGEQSPEEVREMWYDYADTTATFVRNYVSVGSTPPDSRMDHRIRVDQMYEQYQKYISTTPTSPRTKKSLASYIKNQYDATTKTSRKAARDGEEVVRVWDGVHISDEHRDEITERYTESL
jgi:putative DNA primase/helicase